jgi:hypothetical protein
MIRDVLTDSLFRRVCPDCQRPEDLKVTCRHCGSEYPPKTAMEEVMEKTLRLAVGIPVAVVGLMTALLLGTLLLKYVFFPVLDIILRV